MWAFLTVDQPGGTGSCPSSATRKEIATDSHAEISLVLPVAIGGWRLWLYIEYDQKRFLAKLCSFLVFIPTAAWECLSYISGPWILKQRRVSLQEAHMHAPTYFWMTTAMMCNAFIGEVLDQSILNSWCQFWKNRGVRDLQLLATFVIYVIYTSISHLSFRHMECF